MLADSYLNELSKQQVMILPHPKFDKNRNMIFSSGGKAVGLSYGTVGQTKIHDKKKCIKIVDKLDLFDVRLCLLSEYLHTYTEVAKFLLLRFFDETRLPKWKIVDYQRLKHNAVPLYAKVGFYSGRYAYVDLKSAYYSIMHRFLGCEYQVFKYLSVPMVRFVLPDDKRVKVSAFGIIRSNLAMMYNQNKVFLCRVKNRLLMPHICNLVYDVLNCIAWEVLNLCSSCVYINTDGYIVAYDDVETVMKIANSWGFKASVRYAGENCEVRGCGAYKVGSYSSLSFSRVHSRDYYKILANQELHKWLKDRYVTALEKSGFYDVITLKNF